jgi:hypothetical protein
MYPGILAPGEEPERQASVGSICLRQATRTKQSVILRLDRRVAFAGGFSQAFRVYDLDVSTAVVDQIGLLQGIGHPAALLAVINACLADARSRFATTAQSR